MPNKTRYAEPENPRATYRQAIGKLLEENFELREQIANIILETASLREVLESKKTHH
jgi:hypothetical protein